MDQKLREKRKKRIRKKISGTAERPRLSVFRSAKHIYAQAIDDLSGKTIVGMSTSALKDKKRASVDVCKEAGLSLAKMCKDAKIDTIVFDRNGFVYHGRVKAFAEGLREGGLVF